MIPASRDLTAADILSVCSTYVPVNTTLDAALDAHRTALARLDIEGQASRQLAEFALRAVILARIPAREDRQRQFEYLAGLPELAWEIVGTEHREATLAAVSRSIAWFQLN